MHCIANYLTTISLVNFPTSLVRSNLWLICKWTHVNTLLPPYDLHTYIIIVTWAITKSQVHCLDPWPTCPTCDSSMSTSIIWEVVWSLLAKHPCCKACMSYFNDHDQSMELTLVFSSLVIWRTTHSLDPSLILGVTLVLLMVWYIIHIHGVYPKSTQRIR